MIKAVLWDFGGVITSSPFEAFNSYESTQGLPRNFIRSVNSTNPDTNAWAQLECSQVSLKEFDILFAEESELAGHRIPGTEVLSLLSGEVRPEMVRALKLIKSQYKLACLTNNMKGAGEGPGMVNDTTRAAEIAEIMAVFDFVVQSSVVGFRKPDPRFYQLACEQASIEPHEAVFLDDLGVNLKPARAMGMTTIKVLSASQALKDLSDVLDLDVQLS